MLAEDVACNTRNTFKGEIFNDQSHDIDLYGDNIEVDYRGDEVTVENFLRVLYNRHPPGTPREYLSVPSGIFCLVFLNP